MIFVKLNIAAASQARDIIATFKEAEDLINIGAYEKGSNIKIDKSIKYIDKVNNYLKQGVDEKSSFEDNINNLKNIFR